MVFRGMRGGAGAAFLAHALLCRSAADAACDGASGAPLITWAATSNRIYVSSGCATVADIYNYRTDKYGAKGPIYHFDQATNTKVANYTGTYYMEANIHIRNGATLEIDGTAGDAEACETLLLASNKDLVGTSSLNVRAHGGNLVVRNTKIFGWDIYSGGYDTNTDDGRAYLSAVTEFLTGRPEDLCPSDTKAGTAGYSTGQAKEQMGIARMDIYDSEIAYLGYSASESYGVSYKARGLCKTLENLDIFDDDKNFPVFGQYAVYGDIYRSDLHHMWFGHFSYGHQGGNWIDNDVHDNVGYGFDPHDDSDHLTIKNNRVYNNGWHGIIASKRCTDVTIEGNQVWNNKKNGIMLHRQCDRAVVSGNTVYENGDAGVALYESSDCDVFSNTLTDNPRGIRWSQGANRNTVHANKITLGEDENHDYAFYLYAGNDEPQAVGNPDGHPRDNVIYDNEIWSGQARAWYVKEADDNEFYGNIFHKGSEAFFQESLNNYVHGDTYSDPSFSFKIRDSCFTAGTDVAGVPICASDGTIAESVAPTPAPVATYACDGILNKDVCCSAGCGQCGGLGCRNFAEGLDAHDCCTSRIIKDDVTCSADHGAPCIVRAIDTPSAPTTFECDGVQKNEFCCLPGCGTCGGSGCNGRNGLNCCTSTITEMCSVTGTAPCIIDDY